MNSLTLQLVTDQQTKVFFSSTLSEFPFRQPFSFIIRFKLVSIVELVYVATEGVVTQLPTA